MPAQAWVTLIVGLLAVVGVVGTVSQRTRADNRSQSWQRITWCLERTVSDNPDEAALGWTVFGTVAATPSSLRPTATHCKRSPTSTSTATT